MKFFLQYAGPVEDERAGSARDTSTVGQNKMFGTQGRWD